jgi:superfamily II DNA/RNA helicase
MPAPIKKLADRFLSNPKSIEVARPATAGTNITQRLVKVDSRKKREALRAMLEAEEVLSAVIFCNRKTTVRDLNKSLQRHGFRSSEIHGDMDQSSRIKELDRFKNGEVNILVASDVAARGLDIKGVSHVFNFDTPWHPDDYVHRIGRTGRAGAKGRAFTFVSEEDAEAIDNVEKLTGAPVPVFGKSDVRVEIRAPEPAPERESEADAEERRPRRERSERPEREERQRREREPREDRPRRDERPRDDRSGEERPRRDDRPRREARDDGAAMKPGEWNGPVPSFLDVGFG